MVLLGDVGKWKLILVCLDIILISRQDRCTVCTKCTIGSEIAFWAHQMLLLGAVDQVEDRFSLFGEC
jgi:hypothetical protein